MVSASGYILLIIALRRTKWHKILAITIFKIPIIKILKIDISEKFLTSKANKIIGTI